jgi:hypothetical protein
MTSGCRHWSTSVRLLRVAADSPTLRDAGAGRKRRVQLASGRIAAVVPRAGNAAMLRPAWPIGR